MDSSLDSESIIPRAFLKYTTTTPSRCAIAIPKIDKRASFIGMVL
jgi:hypothetical protein